MHPDTHSSPGPHHAGRAAASILTSALRLDGGAASAVRERLADETPVSLSYNGAPYAVMLATPADLEDFAIGFTLAERLVADPGGIMRVAVVPHARGIDVQVELSEDAARLAVVRARRLPGRTGCGLCGVEQIDALFAPLPAIAATWSVDAASVTRAMRALARQQPLNDACGATHAAAWSRDDGVLGMVREDVGRHNALDKLAGALHRAGMHAPDGFVVMTSRGSYELVQKSVLLGVPLLACVSAPTALAVRIADSAGLALAGFARDERMTLYSHATRVRDARVPAALA